MSECVSICECVSFMREYVCDVVLCLSCCAFCVVLCCVVLCCVVLRCVTLCYVVLCCMLYALCVCVFGVFGSTPPQLFESPLPQHCVYPSCMSMDNKGT